MPYRILEYEIEIMKSAIDIRKVKNKEYKLPLVIPIVLYTGKKKWDAQRSIKFVNKLKRKKAIGMLPDVIPQENAPAGNASSAPASEEA